MASRRLPLRAYIFTWLGLLALTGLTFGLSFTHMGSVDVVVALSIAALKAALVAVVFMHLYEQRGLIRLVLLVSVLFLVLLVSLMVADVMTRDEPGAWPPDQGSLLPSAREGR